jgi:two-component system response regulator VicR
MSDRADGGEAPQTHRAALVLIIDDEEPIAEALSFVVEEAGYVGVTAASGQAALEIVQAGARPALVITDLMMPKMDGIAVTGALRTILGAAMPPVVVMTAVNVSPMNGLGVDAVLEKPFDLVDIERLLHRFLAQK